MLEFFEDTALHYATGDASVLTTRMKTVLNMSQEEVKTRRAKAKNRASFFSWDRTAELTLEVLKTCHQVLEEVNLTMI